MDDAARRPARDVRTRRDAAHRERRPGGAGVPKDERKFRLTQRASLMLDTQALATGRKASEILEALIVAHCGEYELHRRGAGQGGQTAG
jgi:hypothetical protein